MGEEGLWHRSSWQKPSRGRRGGGGGSHDDFPGVEISIAGGVGEMVRGVNVVQALWLIYVGGVHSVEAGEYIGAYFHAHLLKLWCNSGLLSQLMLQSFLLVTGVVADLIPLLQILTKLFA